MTASRTRWVISLLAIAGTLPYITLKVLWLSGSRVGLSDPSFGDDAVMHVANALTMGLDVAAIALALAFVTRWGLGLRPGWVLFPMWIGTGFLAPIVLVVPLQVLVAPPAASGSELPPIADWVFALVYGGFVWQGIFLLTGFALHVRARWGVTLAGRERGFRPVTRYDAGVVAALVGTTAAAAALVTHVVGTFRPQAVNVAGDLVMTGLAALGVLLLAGWVGRRLPRWLGIGAWWVGSGALAAWSAYLLVLLLVPNDLVGDAATAWTDLVAEAVRLVAGVGCAVVGGRLLAGDLARREVVRPSVASGSPTTG